MIRTPLNRRSFYALFIYWGGCGIIEYKPWDSSRPAISRNQYE